MRLGFIGFVLTLTIMAAFLGLILFISIFNMPDGLPAGRKDTKFREVCPKNANINWLSFACMFLFGARDVWFVIGIPINFYAVLSDGTTEGNRAAFCTIGSFMALWIALYGVVQASAPKFLRAKTKSLPDLIREARQWRGCDRNSPVGAGDIGCVGA